MTGPAAALAWVLVASMVAAVAIVITLVVRRTFSWEHQSKQSRRTSHEFPQWFVTLCMASVVAEAVALLLSPLARNAHSGAFFLAGPFLMTGMAAFYGSPVTLLVGIALARRRGRSLASLGASGQLAAALLLAQTIVLGTMLAMAN